MGKTVHLLDDPYLAPYAEVIRARARRADACSARLTGSRRASAARLADWARAHDYYGLHVLPSGDWVFRERAPHATAIWLVGDFSHWKLKRAFALRRLPDSDTWEATFPADALRHGQHYRLEMQWAEGRGERIPAYARRVVQDAATGLFAAQVWRPTQPYRWQHDKARRRGVQAAPRIYEAHVGMASEEPRVATYAEFRQHMLPRIARAGYDTLQLMAVMEHPYYGSFGYHVSSFFAASSRFGTPEELKELVDAAHGLGLAVIMDLVHSHAVKNERDGLSCFDGTPYQFFHDGPRGWHTAWDSRCFDYGKTEVLHFLLSNCRFWLDEYHLDGYRFDGVTSMLYYDHGLGDAFTHYGMYFNGSVDEDAWTYLRLANDVVHAVKSRALTIAEDVSGMPGCAAPAADGGLGFDFRLAMGEPDYWFKLADQRDEDWNMHGLFHALTDRRREEKVIAYVESHDQALVGGKSFFFQLVDADIYYGMGRAQHNLAVERGVALHKMARLATFACAGTGYLAFMGNEFGHPEWIDFPRAENGWSYAHARRLWSLRDDPDLLFSALGDFDVAMLALPRAATVWAAAAVMPLTANDGDQVLAFYRAGFVFIFNFNPTRSFTDYGILVPPGPGAFRHVLDTDEPRFGGQGRIRSEQSFRPAPVLCGPEQVDQIKVYLPARTALVLRVTGSVCAESGKKGTGPGWSRR